MDTGASQMLIAERELWALSEALHYFGPNSQSSSADVIIRTDSVLLQQFLDDLAIRAETKSVAKILVRRTVNQVLLDLFICPDSHC